MNTLDILKYGNLTSMKSVKAYENYPWEKSGACGIWSVKDILSHLASYEFLLLDAFKYVEIGGFGNYLTEYRSPEVDFNDHQVDLRKNLSIGKIMDEYNQAHLKVIQIAENFSDETLQKNGTIPWYGSEYCMNDLIVYMNYGHKREHSAQINAFIDVLDHQQNR